jgi:hypothetical protein
LEKAPKVEKRMGGRGFRLPARFHGAADIALQGMGIDVGPLDLAAFLEGIFQNQFPVIFVAALDRQTQADMLALGIPDLFALQAPAQRKAIDFQCTAPNPASYASSYPALGARNFAS